MKEANFKFRKSFYTVMSDMTENQKGEYISGICGYVFEGKPLQTQDPFLKGVFLFVKRELDDSAKKSLNGKKGAIACAEKRARVKEEQRRNGFAETFPCRVYDLSLMDILESCLKDDLKSEEKEGKVLHGKGEKEAG